MVGPRQSTWLAWSPMPGGPGRPTSLQSTFRSRHVDAMNAKRGTDRDGRAARMPRAPSTRITNSTVPKASGDTRGHPVRRINGFAGHYAARLRRRGFGDRGRRRGHGNESTLLPLRCTGLTLKTPRTSAPWAANVRGASGGTAHAALSGARGVRSARWPEGFWGIWRARSRTFDRPGQQFSEEEVSARRFSPTFASRDDRIAHADKTFSKPFDAKAWPIESGT